jgi:hypothetical protein
VTCVGRAKDHVWQALIAMQIMLDGKTITTGFNGWMYECFDCRYAEK